MAPPPGLDCRPEARGRSGQTQMGGAGVLCHRTLSLCHRSLSGSQTSLPEAQRLSSNLPKLRSRREVLTRSDRRAVGDGARVAFVTDLDELASNLVGGELG